MAKHRDLKEGEVLFEEDGHSGEMYVIGQGHVKVTKRAGDTDMTVAELGPGDFVGEMSLLLGTPRSCTAVATADTSLVVYDAKNFQELIRHNPAIANRIIHLLARRLKETTDRLAALHAP